MYVCLVACVDSGYVTDRERDRKRKFKMNMFVVAVNNLKMVRERPLPFFLKRKIQIKPT